MPDYNLEEVVQLFMVSFGLKKLDVGINMTDFYESG